MAVKSKEEILEAIRAMLGEAPEDEGIAILEDIADTLGELEAKPEDAEDWKARYEENDREWRKKYTDRFFQTEEVIEEVVEEVVEEAPKTFEDLFE